MPKKSSSSTTLFYADKFDEGLRTDVSSDKAPEGSLVQAENLRYIPSGGFYMRRGTDEIGAWTPATSYRIEQFGKCVEHDVLFLKSGTKIFHTISEDAPLYSVGWLGTAGYRGMFREYNSEMKYTNGIDIYLSITVGVVLTQFTNASTSIVTEPGHTDQFRIAKTATFTATAATDIIAATAHGLLNGDRVAFTNSGGALPAGLSAVTEYFVKNSTTNDFQVSATPGGSAVDITGTGSGTHTFTDGILYCKGSLITYTGKKTATFTAVAANDTITATAHGFQNRDIVQFTNSGGALPAGLSTVTNYFIISATTDTFKVSTTEGGSAVNMTDAGTGTHTYVAQKGGDTFNGCTVPSGTYAVGEVLTQTKDVPGAPKGTVLETQFEKMIVAGTLNAGHAEYYSVTANTDTPHNIDDFTGTGSDSELFGKFGTVTAMESLLTKMYVAKQKGIEAWTTIDADGIPVREPYTEAYGIVNHDCFIQFGDKLAMLTDTRRQKTIEPDTTGANPEPIINPYFDRKITGTLKLLDFSQDRARMGYSEQDNLLRTTVEEDNLLKTLVYDAETKGYSIDTGYQPSCWIEWRGNVYFGDANDDIIWKGETGFTDGSASSPSMVAVSPQHFVGDRRRKQHVDQIFLTGLIKTQTLCNVDIFCDGDLQRTVELDGSASYVSASVFRPLGRDSIGYTVIGHSGGSPGDDDGFEFAVPVDVNFECRYVQLRFRCQGTGYGVQIDSYEGVAGEVSNSSATQIEAI
ncbi:hypothetical protein EXS70_05245 [Candidatus Peribacteria bacterium]|nr:hypothetical protein [Candidatus Peribacteria bacterium]